MQKPKLRTPPHPEIVYMDLDAPLFSAAAAGEQVIYSAVTPEGETIGSFTSASEYKNWLEVSQVFGADTLFNYEGDLSELTRETSYEIKEFDECIKAFESILKQWFKLSGCKDWVGYISKASGEKNFRYDIATIKPYKGSRSELRKPYWLEEMRKYAKNHPKIKVPRGPYEVDDLVCAKAQKKGWKGCVQSVDKDSCGVNNTHYLIVDEMTKPEFSSNKIIGKLYKNNNDKVVGCGTLFWLYQVLAGDSVDNIPGCKGVGSKKAFNLLESYSEVDASHLDDALRTVCDAYKSAYGEVYEYEHCYTGELVTASHVDLVCEMSELVYMKKSKADACFWLDRVREIGDEQTSR